MPITALNMPNPFQRLIAITSPLLMSRCGWTAVGHRGCRGRDVLQTQKEVEEIISMDSFRGNSKGSLAGNT